MVIFLFMLLSVKVGNKGFIPLNKIHINAYTCTAVVLNCAAEWRQPGLSRGCVDFCLIRMSLKIHLSSLMFHW